MNLSGTITGYVVNGRAYCREHTPEGWLHSFVHEQDLASQCVICGKVLSVGDAFYSARVDVPGTTTGVDEAQDLIELYTETMDGDFDSGMASAGHGTDEDYGYYGEDPYDN